MAKRKSKIKNPRGFSEELLDVIEADMDYYLGHDRENTIQNILEFLKEYGIEIRQK